MIKELLKKHVLENGVLLHRSPRQLTEIKPFFTDDEFAVCATQHPEIAIYMAIVRACKPETFSFNVFKRDRNCKATLRLCEEALEYLMNNTVTGYVYLLDATPFKQYKPSEYRAYESLYAQQRFIVTKEHLPFFPTPGQLHYDIHLDHCVAQALN
ncbi:MAG: hypothetical protein ACOYMZ_01820 [Minisyncoccia bacterium]